MNIIELDGKYFIEVDDVNHTLKQRYTGEKKDGTKYQAEKVCGYFGKLDGAIDKYIKLNQIDSMAGTSVDLRGYVSLVYEANMQAVKAIKSIVEGNHAENE